MDKQPVRDMDAFIDPVHSAAFDNCIKALAVATGMSAKSLYRRLDDNDAMPLRFTDFVSIFWSVDESSRRAMVQPFLDDLGLVATPRIDAEDEVEAEIQELLLDQQEQASRFMRAIRQAKADGRIDAAEIELIRNERRSLAENGNTIMTRIEKMHEKGLRLAKA